MEPHFQVFLFACVLAKEVESYDNDINYVNNPAECLERNLGIKTTEQLGMLRVRQPLSFVEAKFTANSWQEGRHTAELAPLK